MLKERWEKIKDWLNENTLEIAWFLIGVMAVSFLRNLSDLDFTSAFVSAIFMFLLYATRKTKF